MSTKSWLGWGWQWQLGGCVALVGVLSAGVSECSLAQIVPDKTLGTEGSVVKPNVKIKGIQSDRIEGGAARGANLFHSFQDFNVKEGRGVYFANPASIENILTRVTGRNTSNILGRLGVLGEANLFLLNPNGIIFGKDASLDIQGSFAATTAERIQLGDSGYFSALEPQKSRLLSVSPGALFFSQVASQPMAIINQGNLSTGKDLSLSASNLDLQGQLVSGEDLTLQAQDTVKMRDSAAVPFIASAEGNLLAQGNNKVDIFALNHSDSGLFSGGDMVLRSTNTVEGDAHYWSGGSFRTEQLDGSLGSLSSPHDPILRAIGDVFIDTYQGASLHILAGGKVEIPGYIWIEGADPENGLVEKVKLADGTTVAIDGKKEPTLDIRAGVNPDVIGVTRGENLTSTGSDNLTVPSVIATSNPSSADIKIGTIIFATVAQPLAGQLLLTNQYQPNSSLSGDIQVTQTLQDAFGAILLDGGVGNSSVVINSRGSITLDGTVYTGAFYSTSSNTDNGGEIALSAKNNITTGNLYSATRGAGNGGTIHLEANDGSISTGDLDSSSEFNSGNLYSATNAGNGGAIHLEANDGSISTGDLDSSSESNSDKAGRGGDITISAVHGNIKTQSLDSSSLSIYADTADTGGAITLSAGNDIKTQSLDSFTYGFAGTGAGGAITLSAGADIDTESLNSSTGSQGDANTGGAITLSAGNDIKTQSLDSYSRSQRTKAGLGGAITLSAGANIDTLSLNSTSIAYTGGAGVGIADTGGAITLSAGADITTQSLDSFSYASPPRAGAAGGASGAGGAATLSATDTINLTSINSSGAKGSGNITINSNAPFALNNGAISSDTFGSSEAGNIQISAPSISLTNGAQVSASTHNTEAGGNITLVASDKLEISGETTSIPQGIFIAEDSSNIVGLPPGTYLGGYISNGTNQLADGTVFPSGVFSQTTVGSTGSAGNLKIETGKLIINDGAAIATTTFGKGNAGDISIKARDSIKIDRGSILSGVAPDAIGNSGNVELNTSSLELINSGIVQTQTLGDGFAGNIAVDAGKVSVSNQGSALRSASGGSNELLPGTFSSQIGRGGNINVTANNLQVTDEAVLDATTATNSTGGDITASANTLSVDKGGQILTSTAGTGNAGDITVNATQIQLSDLESGLLAQTNSAGKAGNLTVQPRGDEQRLNVVFQKGAQISASTSAKGQGGNLFVKAPEAVTIDGDGQLSVETSGAGAGGSLTIETQRLKVQDKAQVSASTSSINPKGVGGNISVNASQSLDLSQGARLLAESNGVAPAGNIAIDTRNLTARDSTITTSSEQSSGGTITGTASEIRLFGDSDITTRVNKGTGGGGDIVLKADSILAFDDNDILAYAEDGKGGDITLDTPVLLARNYRPASSNTDPRTLDNNNRVDINATGAISGVITIPDVTFIQNSLTELPENQINTDTLLANSCIARRNQPTKGSFIVTGSGGLPQRPGEAQLSSFPTVDMATVPSDAPSFNTSSNRPWKKGDPIVEPQGVYRLSNGKLVLSRECS